MLNQQVLKNKELRLQLNDKSKQTMTAIKAFTSLEQSHKLAEVLPHESADMTWEQVAHNLTEDFQWEPKIGLDVAIKENLFSYRNGYVLPCWSLAALLSVLPHPQLEQYKDDTWTCSVFNKNNHFIDDSCGENPVDACYELILKLHDLNLL